MKLLKFLAPVLVVTVMGTAQAQTTNAKQAFTDEDLKKYAITMDSVKGMQQTLTAIITEMVQTNTVMSVERYNQLFKIADDQAKLAEAKATPEEIQFVKDVADKRKEEFARINATFQGLVKDYLTVKTYNAIKKSLDSDEAVKTKYQAISKEVSGGSAASASKGGE
jgi:hypothetical protein